MRVTHANPNRPDRIASAPYNFVPLPEKVVKVVESADRLPNHDTYADHDYPNTGYFTVTLTTKSPLYVRAPVTLADFIRQQRGEDKDLPFRQQVKHTSHFFYTRDQNQPVIPGSSLRGMLRALLEIASYGKLHHVANKNLIYRAVGDQTSLGTWYREQTLGTNQASRPNMKFDYPRPELKGGYLCRHNGEWAIQPAKEHLAETFVHVPYADAEAVGITRGRQLTHDVFVKPAARSANSRGRRGQGTLTLNLAVTTSPLQSRTAGAPTPPGMESAVLVESGHMGRPSGEQPGPHDKHWHCAIYEANTNVEPIRIPHDMWLAYEEDRDMTRGIQTRRLDSEGQPLFYIMKNNQLVFFGPTMMFRLPYTRSIHNLIPDELLTEEAVDYTDGLFGFVHENGRVRASRLFVSDATLTSDVEWLTDNNGQPITPRILATPKPTTFQHYLVQPASEKDDLSHYDSPKEDTSGSQRGYETTIRGHKLYWHQEDKTARDLQAKRPQEDRSVDWLVRNEFELVNGKWIVKPFSKQYTQFKPAKSGATFEFRLYFENLSDRELGALCWMLQPALETGREYCHNLGMGKPLGMGAIKLEAKLHLIERQSRYKSLFNKDNSQDAQWQTGERQSEGMPLSDEEIRRCYTSQFESHVLRELKLENHCQNLSQVKRIGILLKMMEWPGYKPEPPTENTPAHSQNRRLPGKPNTRYMLINLSSNLQPSERNEYRERPVLPDPMAFDDRLTQLAEPPLDEGEVVSDQPPKSLQHQALTPASVESDEQTISSPLARYTVGKEIMCKDAQQLADGSVLLTVPDDPDAKRIYAKINAGDWGVRRFQQGNSTRCEIVDIQQETGQRKRTVLVCKLALPKGKKK